MRLGLLALVISMPALLLPDLARAQDYGARLGSVKRGGEVSFAPTGPGVLFDALDPTVKKWYIPQELYNEYRWSQGEYSNYARSRYERYVGTAIEGDYFYDLYGDFVTHGWLVYDWHQDQPRQFGSSIFKTQRFSSWFNNVLISADSKGQYNYTITVGDEIRTTLTPMTFSKPAFNGVQWDFAADKYEGTLLLSRPSRPAFASQLDIPEVKTSATNLVGGRGLVQVGDFAKVGATYVTAFQAQTLQDNFTGNPFTGGGLATSQNALPVSRIIIRLSDDSPADGTGGAALFDEDIIIHDTDGNVVRGSEIGFEARREGGFQRVGYLAADGDQSITLTYDFADPSYAGPDMSVISQVTFELVVSNDYRVEVTSNRQTNADNQPVYLLVARSPGNYQDNSNQRVLRFDYGLPTANSIYGFTVQTTDLGGFDFYGEYDVNQQYRQYPNVNTVDHHKANTQSEAWMLNLSRIQYPWFMFLEGYSMDSGYSTSTFLVGTRGQDEIDYADKNYYVYEFVEDNDDQDRYPDWTRYGEKLVDNAVFPGYDENNDFISDFNQNDTDDRPNLIPDYEEPFLRYRTDRPEFLFGIDQNNNGVIDRFENDEAPDYPYKRDHRGYNLYVGMFLTPEARLTVGHMDERLLSGDGRNRTSYLLFTYDQDFAGLGRVRAFENLKLARDDIPDNLFQWVQPPNSRGTQQRVFDPLAARDTWINSSYLQFDYRQVPDLNVTNKLKVETFKQRSDASDLRDTGSFVGLINKADYTFSLSRFSVQPRWKSEFLRQHPVRTQDPVRRELIQTASVITQLPVLQHTTLQLGFELSHFTQFRDHGGVPVNRNLAPDSNSRIFAVQFSNASDYLGYKVIMQTGFRLQHQTSATQPSATTSTLFMTAYAGLGSD